MREEGRKRFGEETSRRKGERREREPKRERGSKEKRGKREGRKGRKKEGKEGGREGRREEGREGGRKGPSGANIADGQNLDGQVIYKTCARQDGEEDCPRIVVLLRQPCE